MMTRATTTNLLSTAGKNPYAKVIQTFRAKAESDPRIRVATDSIPELNGADWSFLQSQFDSGRYVLRGMPAQLRNIDQVIHPWILFPMILGFVLPVVAAIIFRSWFILLIAPTFYCGFLLWGWSIIIVGRSCLRVASFLIILPFLIWALNSGRMGFGACGVGIFLGVIYGTVVSSFGRVFRALRQSEEIFCFFFGLGSVWIDDKLTGEAISTMSPTEQLFRNL